ncbi:MAG: hypothetical protein JO211_15940 [Acidobacteriaceae bacterium]|nr:hypothetical protein [Acidobacteriaceae bacterium]
MNMVGWLGGGGLAPVTIGFLAQHIGLVSALSLTGCVYLVGGVVLLAASSLILGPAEAGKADLSMGRARAL